MKRIGITTTAALAILALTAASIASTATALEILPTPTATSPLSFTDKAGPGTPFGTLTNLLNSPIECKKDTSKGSFTTATLGTIELRFEECGQLGQKCTGLKDEAGKITFKGTVHFADGLLSGKQVAAFAFLTTEVTHFTCGIVLFEVLAGGCQAGLVLENSLNKLVEKVFVAFLLKEKINGDTDIPFINLPTESACELKLRVSEGEKEDMSAFKQEGTGEQEIEGFKQNGVAVTVLLHT
jgi:hypothetical protein